MEVLNLNSNNRVLTKIGDILIDSLSYFRWNNAVKFLDKYNAKKEKRKINGKETLLILKFIIEILNNAFQEDNEGLQDNWNNVLINWQDLEKNRDKKYMYLEILKKLGSNEIKFLKLITKEIIYKDFFNKIYSKRIPLWNFFCYNYKKKVYV